MMIPAEMPRLKGYRFPREVVAYAVWAYHRFALSTADVEDLLAERGVTVSVSIRHRPWSCRAPALCGCQFQGRRSGTRDAVVPGSRARTSASHACGSMSFIFAVTIKEYMKAALSPPRSEPAKSQDLLPSAIPRSARSAALLVRQIRPSFRKSVKASQRSS